MEWKDGKLTVFRIKMGNTEKLVLQYNDIMKECLLEKDKEYVFDSNLILKECCA